MQRPAGPWPPVAAEVPPPPRTPSPRARSLVIAPLDVLFPGLLGTGLGLLFSVVFGWGIPFEIALDTGATVVKGKVTGTEVRTWEKRNKQHPTILSYRFVLDREEHQGTYATIDTGLIARAKPGAALDIEVVPWLPVIHRPKGTSYAFFGYLGAPALVMFPIGLITLAFGAGKVRRRRRTYTHGQPIEAEVTEERHYTYKGQPRLHLAWRFATGGATYEGTFHTSSPAVVKDVLGKPIVTVLHDPARPSQSLLYLPPT